MAFGEPMFVVCWIGASIGGGDLLLCLQLEANASCGQVRNHRKFTLGLLVLGYARNDRYLLSIGILFFPVFIVVFYYEWQFSLFIKSWILMGSGAVLLVTR